MVDEVVFGQSLNDLKIDRKSFFEWYYSLKNNVLPDNYLEKKASGELMIETQESLYKASVLGEEPYYKYSGYINQPYTYTYRGTFYIKSGVYTEFHTANPNPSSTDPVMYLYSESDPVSYSWSNDDGAGNLQSRIATPIYSTGYYHLVIRSYSTYSAVRMIICMDMIGRANPVL